MEKLPKELLDAFMILHTAGIWTEGHNWYNIKAWDIENLGIVLTYFRGCTLGKVRYTHKEDIVSCFKADENDRAPIRKKC